MVYWISLTVSYVGMVLDLSNLGKQSVETNIKI